MRIGYGFDAHGFTPGDGVTLGGEWIPCDRGIDAHSDGDVVIHALCDALLGAAGLGDLGVFFPDTDPNLENIDSRRLLRDVISRVMSTGYSVGNVDITVVTERPRISPHREAMITNLARELGVDVNAVSVKATSTDGLGYTGRHEGISAHAVVLLKHKG